MKTIIQKSKELALWEIKKYWSPSIILFEISRKKWIELAEKLWADKEIVEIWTCLMDLKLWEALSRNSISEHITMSMKWAKEFLAKQDITEEKKNLILHCVEAHHGTIPFNSLEAEICANADCYRFLSSVWIFQFIKDLSKRYDNLMPILKHLKKKMDEKHGILSLDICKQELEKSYNVFSENIDNSLHFLED